MKSEAMSCFLTNEYPRRGLALYSVNVERDVKGDQNLPWPAITLVDKFDRWADYFPGLGCEERSSLVEKVATLEARSYSAEKIADEARRNLFEARQRFVVAAESAAASLERIGSLQFEVEKLRNKDKESKALAKSWKAKADYRDKKIAELRDALDQERSKPLIRFVRERAASGFKRLIAAVKGSA